MAPATLLTRCGESDPRAVDLGRIVHLARRHLLLHHQVVDASSHGGSSRLRHRIYMKMDIEGSELRVLPHLIATQALCVINELSIEWHEAFFTKPSNRTAYSRALRRQTMSLTCTISPAGQRPGISASLLYNEARRAGRRACVRMKLKTVHAYAGPGLRRRGFIHISSRDDDFYNFYVRPSVYRVVLHMKTQDQTTKVRAQSQVPSTGALRGEILGTRSNKQQ